MDAMDRKPVRQVSPSPEGQLSCAKTRNEQHPSTTLVSAHRDHAESALAAGLLTMPGGEVDNPKASPPRMVRREKKPSAGCGDKREDAATAAAAVSRSEYIQLSQLERMLEGGGRIGASAGKNSEPDIVPPKRTHDSPKRREVSDRRIILPPPGEPTVALKSERLQVLDQLPGNTRSSTGETKDTYTDSGYSTLEETLARFDREKLLHQRSTGTEVSESLRTSSETESPAMSGGNDSKREDTKIIATKNTEKSPLESRNEELHSSRYSDKACGSTGSDLDCAENVALAQSNLKTGYSPVKNKEDREQERSRLLDSSKLEDIRLLSTAILEYLQSRNSEDHSTDEFLKDDSNYTIFKNAELNAPPLPQKKHRVLPSPIKVGQALKTTAGIESGTGRQMELDEVQASTLGPHLAEPTHMNWEEVLREAKMLGIPLSLSSPRCRSSSDRRSSMSSSAASSDISHQSSPCSSPIRTTKRKSGKEESSGKDRDQKTGASNRLSIFNLQGWLSKLRRPERGSSKDASMTNTTPKRRQHLSCSSERNNTVSASLVQRRSLSASATQRNRINLSAESCTCNPGTNISSSLSNKSPTYRPSSSLTYDISASGSRGSSNSFLSASMIASPSTSSLGSVFSRSSRGSSGNPLLLSAASRDLGIGLHSTSPLSSSVSPLNTGSGGSGGGGGGKGGGQRTPATLGISQTYSRRTAKSPSRNSRNLDLMKTIDQLKDCGWYWGSLGWEEARMKLESAPNGAFLLRDSSDDRYLFSLSFKSQGKVHHTRIEHYKGTFNFSSQPSSLASASIVELIDRAMAYSQTHPYVSCLQPRPPGLNPIPIQLLYPVSRSTLLPSLQQLCRSAIVRSVRINDIDRLPITDRLKNYVRISQQI